MDNKQEIILKIVNGIARAVPGVDERLISAICYMELEDCTITKNCTEIGTFYGNQTEALIQKFLITKKVNGCTDRTITMYGKRVPQVLNAIGKPVEAVTQDDIIVYLAKREFRDHVKPATRTGELRCISSFFAWAQMQEYVRKNPCAGIPPIRGQKEKKKAFTEMEIEKMREGLTRKRDICIFELLLSMGCRVTELATIELSSIDGRRILVHGKGQKDRYCYLNAKAILSLKNYLEERGADTNPYLFPKKYYSPGGKKSSAMSAKEHIDKGTIEKIIRDLGKENGIEAHPHKFRRTCATWALKRGMPVEQVSKMLGHESIQTTQIYLDLDEHELEEAHKKYVT